MADQFDAFIGQKIVVEEVSHCSGSREWITYETKDLVIQNLSDLAKKIGMSFRLWLPNTFGTMDLRNDRLNVHVEKMDDGSFEIVKIYIG